MSQLPRPGESAEGAHLAPSVAIRAGGAPQIGARRGWLLLVAPLALLLPLAYGAGTALVVSRDVGAPDAIVALGSHEWERLPVLAELAMRHPGAVVLLTQPRFPNSDNCHRCGERVAWLERLGVAATRIELLSPPVTNTRDEARVSAAFSRENQLQAILVVTSPYHTRRALTTFASAFAGIATRVGVHPSWPASPARPDRWWSDPYDRAYVRYEWAALAWYALRHRVNPFVQATDGDAARETAATGVR